MEFDGPNYKVSDRLKLAGILRAERMRQARERGHGWLSESAIASRRVRNAKIVRLHGQLKDAREISRLVGVSASLVWRIIRKNRTK